MNQLPTPLRRVYLRRVASTSWHRRPLYYFRFPSFYRPIHSERATTMVVVSKVTLFSFREIGLLNNRRNIVPRQPTIKLPAPFPPPRPPKPLRPRRPRPPYLPLLLQPPNPVTQAPRTEPKEKNKRRGGRLEKKRIAATYTKVGRRRSRSRITCP